MAPISAQEGGVLQIRGHECPDGKGRCWHLSFHMHRSTGAKSREKARRGFMLNRSVVAPGWHQAVGLHPDPPHTPHSTGRGRTARSHLPREASVLGTGMWGNSIIIFCSFKYSNILKSFGVFSSSSRAIPWKCPSFKHLSVGEIQRNVRNKIRSRQSWH